MLLEKHLKSSIGSLLPKKNNDKTIAIAFSGGLDSSALLFAASRCWPSNQLMAFHINHQLCSYSDTWEQFCCKQAESLKIAFFSKHVEVVNKHGKGIEASARIERYKALNELSDLHKPWCLLLGHHADDQAETIMFRIIRGTGIDGLTGMPIICSNNIAKSSGAKTIFFRPFLNLRRKDILEYASGRFKWIEDPANRNPCFSRNRIRNFFTEQLASNFPTYHSSILRLSRIAEQYKKLAAFLADRDLQDLTKIYDIKHVPEKIPRDNLLSLDSDRLKNILRRWIQLKKLLPPSESKLNELIKYIYSKNNYSIWTHDGKSLNINKKDIVWCSKDLAKRLLDIRKHKNSKTGKVYTVQHINFSKKNISKIIKDGEIKFPLENWSSAFICLRHISVVENHAINIYALLDKNLVIRPRIGGERMQIKIGGVRRSLKNLFQEHKVPVLQRDLPILLSNDRIVFVPFIGVDLEWAKMTRCISNKAAKGLSYYVEVVFISDVNFS